MKSEVVFGTVIAVIMLREWPTRRQVMGTGVSLAGIVTIVGAPSLEGQMTGVSLVLAGCLCWAFGQLLVRQLGTALTGFQLTAWIGVIAAPQMLLASVIIEGNPLPALATASIGDWATSRLSRCGDEGNRLFRLVFPAGAVSGADGPSASIAAAGFNHPRRHRFSW